MQNAKCKMQNKFLKNFGLLLLLLTVYCVPLIAQEQPPAPSAPRSVTIPNVVEKTLPNGLKVVVVERKNVPLVTASLLIKSGANAEDEALAGVADMTASLLQKGTKTRNATQIAEQIEFLGGDLNSGAGWASSTVGLNVTSDKLDQALAIMSDVILNPTFPQSEIDLYKTQTVDDLNVQLKQPTAIAGFAASRYTFGEHSAFGTPETIAKITRANISDFYQKNFQPNNAVLIFTGDINAAQGDALAQKYFGKWNGKAVFPVFAPISKMPAENSVIKRLLVIDLPNSGQAAVTYAKKLDSVGRTAGANYYSASVLNSILGGDFSARLNLEIRIKRGLSYGAGSNFIWRNAASNFTASAQTKNVSAAEVAELMAGEIGRLTTDAVLTDELTPRKANLTGKFGRSFETTGGLARQISDLYLYGLKTAELNAYVQSVQGVSDSQVKDFALNNLKGGDIIIVGDYKIFADDLRKRFPNQKIEVVPASELNLNSNTLRKN